MYDQILKDLIATAQATGYDWGLTLSKFPELKDFDVQLLKDYVATAEAANYDYDRVNDKFPEFFNLAVKKKDVGEESADTSTPFLEKEKEKVQDTTVSASADGLSESVETEELTPEEIRERQLGGFSFEEDSERVLDPTQVQAMSTAIETPSIPSQPQKLMGAVEESQTQKFNEIATEAARAELAGDLYHAELGFKKALEYKDDAKTKERLEAIQQRAKQEEATKKLQEKEEAERLALQQEAQEYRDMPQNAELEGRINSISKYTIQQNEEDAQSALNKDFGMFGFNFRQIGWGDAIEVIAADGEKMEIDLDTWFDSSADSEASKLRLFLREHAEPPKNFKKGLEDDEIVNAMRIRDMRTGARDNGDGTESTVLMTYAEVDGKYVAYPTLFPKNPNLRYYGSGSEEWLELDGDAALDEAEKRDELTWFENEEEAAAFAEGSWKDVNTFDYEANRFFEKRGVDYKSYRDALDKYDELKETEMFLATRGYTQLKDLPKEEQEKYADFYAEGRLRTDIDEVKEKLARDADNLMEFVNDDEFRTIREDFDVYVQDKFNKASKDAILTNQVAVKQQQALDEESINKFGVRIEELNKYEPTNEAEFEEINNLLTNYDVARAESQYAASQYELANTWFDGKFDKNVRSAFDENWKAVYNSTRNGLDNGQAAQEILYISLGITDMDDDASLEEAANTIVENLEAAQSRAPGRAEYRWNSARDFREGWDAFKDDPFELTATFVAGSLSQMLPYGTKILATSTATGAATGAGIGSFVPGYGTAAGAFFGGAQGFKTGFAATGYAMEYTNSILDVAREKGYNMMDPNEVKKALQDEEVWKEGSERGHKRGVPIAVMDYVTAGIAGRVFKVGGLSSKTARVSAMMGERAVVDPLGEATGEFLAQVNAGEQVSAKEIFAEAMGGFGNNTGAMAINLYKDARNTNNVDLANKLSTIDGMLSENVSETRMLSWADNMEKLGKINAEQAQRIRENLGLKREAKNVLDVNKDTRSNKKTQARVMELMAAQKELTSTANRKAAFAPKIKEIKSEIAEIAETGNLREAGTETNLNVLGTSQATKTDVRSDVGKYTINNISYTKDEFMKRIDKMSKRKILKTRASVKNDEEVSTFLKNKVDAIQEQETGTVPADKQAGVVEEMDSEVREVPSETQESETTETEQVEEKQPTFEDLSDVDQQEYLNKAEKNLKKKQRVTIGQRLSRFGAKTFRGAKVKYAKKTELTQEQIKEEAVKMFELDNQPQVEETTTTQETVATEEVSPTTLKAETEELGKIVDEEFGTQPVETTTQEEVVQEEVSPTTPTETVIEEEAQDNTFVYEMDRSVTATGRGRWEADFEIIDNRPNEQGVKNVEDTDAKWIVVNRITGAQLDAQSKKDAQGIIKNAPAEGGLFEEGQVVDLDDLGPKEQKRFKKVLDAQRQQRETATEQEVQEEAAPVVEEEVTTEEAPVDETVVEEEVTIEKVTPVAEETQSKREEIEAEIADIENNELEDLEMNLEDIQEEIQNEKDNYKEEAQRIKEEKAKVKKNKTLSKQKKQDKLDDLEAERDGFMNDRDAAIENYQFDLSEAKREARKAKSRIAKLKKKLDSGVDFKRKTVNLKDEVQDKGRTDRSSERGTDSARKSSTSDVKEKSRYDVGESNRVVRDDTVVNTVSLSENEAQALSENMKGRAVVDTEFYETNDANLFHKSITESTKNNKYAASVFVYPVSDYKNSRLFLTADGKAGLAITEDGDIISVFSYEEGKGRVPQLIVNAIKEGAVSLDHYDTVLTDYYANFGFAPVAKVAWNNDFSPDNWSKETFKDFNNGEPDVVAMVYDGGNRQTIAERVGTFEDVDTKLQEAPYVVEWDDAKALQTKRNEELQKPITLKEEAKSVDNLNQMTDFMNKAFPNVEMSTDQETFDTVINSDKVRTYLRKGDVVYGVTVDGDVYINPDVHNSQSEMFDTAIHEVGHVWQNYLQTTKKGKQLYRKGVELVQQTEEFQKQLKEFDGDIEAAAREAMAILIGNKGEKIASQSLKAQFKEWLNTMWEFIRSQFKLSEDLTVEEIQDLTIDSFLGTALADIFSGKELKITEVAQKQMKNPEVVFSRTAPIFDVIDRGRRLGFTDAAIREVLKERGFSTGNINEALTIGIVNETRPMPRAFEKVEGGIDEARQLFDETQETVRQFSIMGPRGGVSGVRARNKTFSQIRQKAQETLKANPIFQKQPEQVQQEILLEYDQSLYRDFDAQGPIRSNRRVQAEMAKIRETLKQRKIGKKNLKEAQIRLKNYIRQSLPDTPYTRGAIQRINKLLVDSTVENFESKIEKVEIEIQNARARMKAETVTGILDILKKKSKVKITRSGKRRGAGVNAATQLYFKAVLPIVEDIVDLARARAGMQALQSKIDQRLFDIQNKIDKVNENTRLSAEEKATRIQELESKKRSTKAEAKSISNTQTRIEEAEKKIQKLRDRLNDPEVKQQIDEALLIQEENPLTADKILTTKQQKLLAEVQALDNFSPIQGMTLEETNALLNTLKDMSSQSIAQLKAENTVRRQLRADKAKKVRAQIQETNPELFDENGNPLDTNELNAKKDEVRTVLQEKGFFAASLEWVKSTFKFGTFKDYIRSAKNTVSNIQTLTNIADRITEGKSVFTDNIYKTFNRMDENNNRGLLETRKKIDQIATSAGIVGGIKGVKRRLATGVHRINLISNKKGKQTTYSKAFNADQLMRIYALSLNDVQRAKLENQGIGKEQLQEIKNILGQDVVQFTEGIVNFLSNEYYEQVNSVYAQVNNVNLGFIENYFPTQTISPKVDGGMLENGDFSGIFNSETAPAFKQREDYKSDINLTEASFMETLENHTQTMEKFMAYAEGVREMNDFFSIPEVTLLLKEGRILGSLKHLINQAINPASLNGGPSNKLLSAFQSKFTSFALSFKVIQILKQASSFINAFEDYNYRGKGKRYIPGMDTLGFMFDAATTILSLPLDLVGMNGPIHQAMEMSATFKRRVEQGIEGDVYGLEAGSKTFKNVSKESSRFKRARALIRTSAAAPTVLGDILGVMGYMINYKRNIKNGMSKVEAVEAFNEYNATQQSRRGSDKIALQFSNNALVRSFTMFGSVLFLQMNRVMQSSTNMRRDTARSVALSAEAAKLAAQGKMKEANQKRKEAAKAAPKRKDIRAFALNAALANGLFVATSNLAKFIKGDSDDRDEALKKIKEAMMGLNLIYQIPLLGSVVERQMGNKFAGDVTNPFMSIYYKVNQNFEKYGWTGAAKPLVEVVLGMQTDPFIGLYNMFGTDGAEFDQATLDALGISKSYAPSKETAAEKKARESEGKRTKTEQKQYERDLKKYNPKAYKREFGERDKREEEIKKRKEKRTKGMDKQQKKREADMKRRKFSRIR